ncbi:MAG: hypothetical protein ACKVZ0_23285 [Gemmatimonadales bacterium]
MAKKRVPRADARFIRDRLQRFAVERNGSWAAFVEDLDIGRTTGVNWMSRRDPSVPEPGWLIELARKANLSLNWLLLGAGPKLITAEARTPAEQVCAAVQAELRRTEGLSEEEFNGAWSRLLSGQDLDQQSGESSADAIFQLAVEGVRRPFLESLRLARHYAAVVYLSHATRQYLSAKAGAAESDAGDGDTLLQKAIERLEQLIEAPLDQFFAALDHVRRKHRGEDREVLERQLKEAAQGASSVAKSPIPSPGPARDGPAAAR